MDLKSSSPFWFVQNGLIAAYPALRSDVECDVLVIGAGIGGALLADRLTCDGRDVVVLDRRDVGQGSTCASTAMLLYEIDTHLVELTERMGRAAAERAYRLCRDSIQQLHDIAARSRLDCGFASRDSLYVASVADDVEVLRREAAARQSCGIRCEFIAGPELERRFNIHRPAAIVSPDAATCDPYRLTHGLLQAAVERGGRVFDRTEVLQTRCTPDGVEAVTDRGFTVRARDIVFANGYEAQAMLREPVVQLKSTYAIVTQPLEDLSPWREEWLLWETSRPYLYLRTTPDRRLLIGGEDDDFQDADRRDANLCRKSQRLLRAALDLLPSLPLEIEYAWAGTFGDTDDGLPFIGQKSEFPHAYFALGYGGNGITFSAIAADIIADLLAGRANGDAELFRFGR
jgi:glycine/D-amino acid oxidase-like deaminating enzyme